MAAAGGDDIIIRYTFRGEDGEIIPDEATHITVGGDVTLVRARAFRGHRKIVEIICHDRVERVEAEAFQNCHNLRRVIMPGVKEVEAEAFFECIALTDVECGKLEIIKQWAFCVCKSLKSINLPSVRIVDMCALAGCKALVDVKFGCNLERFHSCAFNDCTSLERITIPLKDGLMTEDNIFEECDNLKQVDLVEGVELHEIISALQLEEWRNDMKREITSINQILSTADPGGVVGNNEGNYDRSAGEKALAIRRWIRSVLRKITHYQAVHQRILDEAENALHRDLPRDILTNNTLPFLKLPTHSFEGEHQEMEEETTSGD